MGVYIFSKINKSSRYPSTIKQLNSFIVINVKNIDKPREINVTFKIIRIYTNLSSQIYEIYLVISKFLTT